MGERLDGVLSGEKVHGGTDFSVEGGRRVQGGRVWGRAAQEEGRRG